MSILRRHGGGRPRAADSILSLAEQWGVSLKAARRIASLGLTGPALAIMVRDSQRHADAQWNGANRPRGSMRSLGMRSRVPAYRA